MRFFLTHQAYLYVFGLPICFRVDFFHFSIQCVFFFYPKSLPICFWIEAGVPVYLAPWTACPPGGKLSRDILPPTLVIFTPGGKLSRPVYLAPRPKQVKIYTCYFAIFLYHFNEYRSTISHKVRNWCLWG